MQTLISSWGNSLAIRIPKPLLQHIGAKKGDAVNIDIIDHKITVSKSKESLADLMSKIKPNNIHTETHTGSITGKEIW